MTMEVLKAAFPVGTRVGAGRWPMQSAHPDCWLAPWEGEVIALDDPRAWANTAAFPSNPNPDQKAVTEHVAAVQASGLLKDRLPVLWFFEEETVYWEENLRIYSDDVEAWRTAQIAAIEACRRSPRN